MKGAERLSASFRDPSGFVFRSAEGDLLRQVSRVYSANWSLLHSSGLLADLTENRLLVNHEEIPGERNDETIATLRPELIPFISYPYEWAFSQLRDAALLTLDIQKRALARGMSLKDASAYNVQFLAGRPIFIDTLSFDAYEEGRPWVAYRQFCSHFLAPLALMALVDVRLGALQRTYLDGIPLDLTSKLLPGTTKLRPGLAAHIHLHARAQRADGKESTAAPKHSNISRTASLALVDSLEGTIKSLDWRPAATEWGDYYSDTNYTASALKEKSRLVGEFLDQTAPTRRTCWDLGANNGEFSQLAAERGLNTLAIDIDPAAVEKGLYEAESGEARADIAPPDRPFKPVAQPWLGGVGARFPVSEGAGRRGAWPRTDPPSRDREQHPSRACRRLLCEGRRLGDHRVRSEIG